MCCSYSGVFTRTPTQQPHTGVGGKGLIGEGDCGGGGEGLHTLNAHVLLQLTNHKQNLAANTPNLKAYFMKIAIDLITRLLAPYFWGIRAPEQQSQSSAFLSHRIFPPWNRQRVGNPRPIQE